MTGTNLEKAGCEFCFQMSMQTYWKTLIKQCAAYLKLNLFYVALT